MDSLKNTFEAIGSTLMAALAPLGEMLIVPLISIGKILLPYDSTNRKIIRIGI